MRHIEIRRGMDVDVADAFEVREHWHARLALHARDEALPAAGNDDVDAALEPGKHQADGGAVRGGHELHRVAGQSGGSEARAQRIGDARSRFEAFRAAAQDGRRCRPSGKAPRHRP